MRKRLISICIIGILVCGIYKYVQSAGISLIAELVVDMEAVTVPIMNIKSVATEYSEDKISSDDYLTVKIQTQEEYERFIGRLEEFTDRDSLSMNLGETDTTIYLDEILAYQNFKWLYVRNGGTISFKDTQILTYPIRSIELSHVSAIEESLLGHIISDDSYVQYGLRIELDNRYLGKLPIEELLNYKDCRDVMLVWDDNTEGEGLLDVQEGMESLKEWDYLQSVWEETGGCLKGIYSLNDEEYSYTSYEFYHHYEESWPESCALFICVKDRKSNGEEYFDIIDIPADKFMDKDSLCRGTSVNRLTRWSDLNFDGYMDLEFHSRNNDSFDPRGYITFLWDVEEQRFKLCESAPEYYDHVDTERKRITRSNTDAWGDDYYIYEYKDKVFIEKHIEIRAVDMYWKNVTEQFLEDGELIARLERVTDEDGFEHYFYEEIGGTREEIQIESDLSFHRVSEIFFPEFDFWKYG